MNAYEKRRDQRNKQAQLRYHKLKDIKLHQLTLVEKYYISAFIALNGQPPHIIPPGNGAALLQMADQLYATIHVIELGGDDE